MAKKNTRGMYYFADGFCCWVNGMSGTEKRNLERQHGKIVRYIPD